MLIARSFDRAFASPCSWGPATANVQSSACGCGQDCDVIVANIMKNTRSFEDPIAKRVLFEAQYLTAASSGHLFDVGVNKQMGGVFARASCRVVLVVATNRAPPQTQDVTYKSKAVDTEEREQSELATMKATDQQFELPNGGSSSTGPVKRPQLALQDEPTEPEPKKRAKGARKEATGTPGSSSNPDPVPPPPKA